MPNPNDNNLKQNAPMMGPGPMGRGRHNMFAEAEHAENTGATLKRILKYFTREKLLMVLLLIIVITGAVFGVVAPSLQSNAIDILSGTRDGELLQTVLMMLGAYLLYAACSLFQGLAGAKLSQKIVKRMREDLFGKIVNLPISYLDSHSHGDIMSRMTNDVENVSNTVSQALPSLFSGVLTIAGTAAMMLILCWQLALLSFLTVILTIVATKIISKYVRKNSRQRQAFLGNLNGTTEEVVSGFKTVVAFNHQKNTIDGFNDTSDKLTRSGIKTEVFGGIMGPVMNCIGNLGFIVIAAFGGLFALNGYITIGVISAFIVYVKQFTRPINEIAQVYGQIQTAIAGAERVFYIMDEADEDMSGRDELNADNATVVFENIDFAYNPKKPVINEFNLKVDAGKKIALVGATGSGKTTIVNLLMRFYDLDKGNIFINGTNIVEISRGQLRKKVAIVLQDTILFSDTIRNNLLYGNENATDEEIQNALKMSRCDKMIARLPDGLETKLVSAGANLSQGQRQLLTIARAFLANPEILILDEATSNVDTRTEKEIQNAMQTIMKGRTSIVIAHRLSTIQDADEIIVMDRGRITESGNHEQLLNQKGVYYNLYMTQFAGFAT